ncbi:MAG: HNH endonuclease [Imperialibacter sp.]|uniref:HNH endonuclease n=1 Tax=Imperialibacter sp. TaxID=2038411 RepID=UPI003A864BD1
MPIKNLWTREELIVALNLYLKLPFGKLHTGTPEIVALAQLIGRSVNSVAIRLNNFAHVDPFHQERGIKGLSGGIKQVQPIWNEFINNQEELLFESERILAEKESLSLEKKFEKLLSGTEHLKGETKIREVKTRVNQTAFRQMVLANYDFRCAMTGIDIPTLLVASHIIPWAQNEQERLNPENGICLSPLYDRAFDQGLLGIDGNYKIILSKGLRDYVKKAFYQLHFGQLEGASLQMPRKYWPRKEFLEWHAQNIIIT